MSITVHEWISREEVKRIFAVCGFAVSVRWDEDWMTYTLTQGGFVPRKAFFRADGNDMVAIWQVRAQMIEFALREKK